MWIEVKEGSEIFYSQPTGKAYVTKMKNYKDYFVSRINKEFNNETSEKIINGEPFILSKIYHDKQTMVCLRRKINNKFLFIRIEDLQYFSCKKD